MFDAQLLIDNQDAAAVGGRTFSRQNPLTGEVATRAAASSVADARAAVEAAAAAFPAWAALGPTDRRLKLTRAAELLQARLGEAVARTTSETGAGAPGASLDITVAANLLREAAAMTSQVGGEAIPSDRPGTLAFSYRQPVGVVLGIAPWTSPVVLGVRALAVPLACGNTVVLKASERCPATHRLLGEVMRDAGLPAGTVNVVTHDPADADEIVEALIAHPAVKRVSVTGSTQAGKLVATRAARHLKPVLLEPGGKAPLIVLDDADLDDAVNAATFGADGTAAPIGTPTELAIVDESVADAFVQKLAARAAALPAGDPRGRVPLSSMLGPEAADRVQALVTDAITAGASLAAGGGGDGTVMNGTILDRVTPEMALYHEACFGAVLGVARVLGVDEAVRAATACEDGLAAAVFSQDILRAFDVAKRIPFGSCHINGPAVPREARTTSGGVEGSGHGRAGRKTALDELTELRWITIEDSQPPYPF